LSVQQQTLASAWLSEQGVPNPAQALAEQGGMPTAAWRAWQLQQTQAVPCDWQAWVRALSQPQHLNPIKLAEQWQKADLAQLLRSTLRWSQDLARVGAGAQAHSYPQAAQACMQQPRPPSLRALVDWQQTLRQRQRIVQHPLNPRLFVEELLLEYLAVFSARAHQ
jgi:DNA polymerase-3 subunit delta'